MLHILQLAASGAFLHLPAYSVMSPQSLAHREFVALDTTKRCQHALRRVDMTLEGDTGQRFNYEAERCVGMRFVTSGDGSSVHD